MKQQELIEIVTQLNTLDLKGEQKNEMTAKVLQMAADSVTLETLKSLLAPDKSKQTATPVFEEAVRPLGRKSKLGFTLTKKEMKSMPEKQRKIFACENRIIPYRFHKGVYEAHYRRDGFKVFACAKDFNQMRKKFAEKLLAQMNGEMPVVSIEKAKPYRAALFRDYLNEWLEIKRKTCKPSTCKEYERLCNYNLIPAFGEKRLDELTRPVI